MKTEKIGADAAQLAGLLTDILRKFRHEQITPEHIEWFSKLTKEQRDKFLGNTIGNTIDNRFKFLNSFELTVPEKYDHAIQLASFNGKYRKEFYNYNDAITDENFAEATGNLVPGKTYKVKILQITESISSEDCLAFLKSEKAILGVQGSSLLWQIKKEEFPIGKNTVSFDQKDALWKDAGGDRRVPSVYRSSDGDWSFYLDYFEGAWDDGYCVLCFCDLE